MTRTEALHSVLHPLGLLRGTGPSRRSPENRRRRKMLQKQVRKASKAGLALYPDGLWDETFWAEMEEDLKVEDAADAAEEAALEALVTLPLGSIVVNDTGSRFIKEEQDWLTMLDDGPGGTSYGLLYAHINFGPLRSLS